jgi:GntR family transcriptional repressor for pyruvate dehydrogenase complex
VETIDYSVHKKNLSEQIADALEQMILRSGTLVQKLPSEQDLCRDFRVSRTVVREALKVLKERGLIQSRNGERSYISKPKTDTISSAINRIIKMDNISNDNLHNMRIILETAAARLAALDAPPEAIQNLESIMNRLSDETISQEERLALDASFHIVIARAGGNELLGTFVEVMTLLLKDYMNMGAVGRTRIQNTIVQHRKVLAAIKSENPDRAERAIYEHLVAARKDVARTEKVQFKKRKPAEGTKVCGKRHLHREDPMRANCEITALKRR